MRLEELYAKYDRIVGAGGLNVTPIEHFVFDLTDENSQNSLKAAFPGIESLLMPESGKYLVASTIVEKPGILVLMFPSQTDGSLGLCAFNTETKKGTRIDNTLQEDEEQKTTLDNFEQDFANGEMESIAKKFNEFAFMDGGENSTTEVKDIGSFEVSTDEPVEITNPNTDNEETKMAFKPINEEELKETKWVEIPNTNAHGVTVTEDGEENADPFADASLDATGDAGTGDATAADANAGDANAADAGTGDAAQGGEAAPAEGDATATTDANAEATPAEGEGAATIDDPKAKMRELLAYYTNYMNELVNDPNTSTELISATQDMIDSLIKNMESADGIEEVKSDQEEAAKEEVNAEETPAEGEGEAAPAEGGDASATTEEQPVSEGTGDANNGEASGSDNGNNAEPVSEGAGCAAAGGAVGAAVGGPIGAAAGAALGSAVEESEDEEKKADDASDAAIDSEIDDLHKDDIEPIEPIEGDDILTPGDIRNSAVNDVDLSDVPPTSDEELAATQPDETAQPTSDVLDDTTLPTPDEEVSLLGTDDLDDYAIGPDGLPVDKFEGDVDALASSPVAKKVNWSTDYSVNGIATSDDNTVVVPEVLKELEDYYKKVADEVSKVPGKEDVAMKLQKIQILSQTIANEWNGIVGQISDTCANSYDLSNMCDLEKDELASQDAMNMVGADVMADQEQDEEDDLAINADVAAFVESFKHLY